MILIDTGPLVAMINRKDKFHERSVALLKSLAVEPLLTTWPCLTESMHFLHRYGGFAAQEMLWKLVNSGSIRFHQPDSQEPELMADLMAKYQNLPMDFADASLLSCAEILGLSRIMSFDSDFQVYRLSNGLTLEVIC